MDQIKFMENGDPKLDQKQKAKNKRMSDNNDPYEGEDTILACLFSDTILAARSCDGGLIFD